MKYIIQVKYKNEINYLQLQGERVGQILVRKPYWLFEEYKRNATQFETIESATKMIGELLTDWLYETYTIYEVGNIEEEGKRYTPIKQISVSNYR